MQQCLATRERNDGCSERCQRINAPYHIVGRHGLREIIELVAILTRQVAAPGYHDMGEYGMVGRS